MAWDYTQTGDPGSVGVGKTWLHPTTGVLKVRNTANTAWTTIGNVDDPSFGSLLTSGGAVSAAITGNTGWAASDAHNFPTSASINSVSIATINDVTSRISALESSIVPLISSAIATYAGSLTFLSKIAVNTGVTKQAAWNTVVTLPTNGGFQYEGGTPVKESECKWIVERLGNSEDSQWVWPTGLSGGGQDYRAYFRNTTDTADVIPNAVSSFLSYGKLDSGGGKFPIYVTYFILALRP